MSQKFFIRLTWSFRYLRSKVNRLQSPFSREYVRIKCNGGIKSGMVIYFTFSIFIEIYRREEKEGETSNVLSLSSPCRRWSGYSYFIFLQILCFSFIYSQRMVRYTFVRHFLVYWWHSKVTGILECQIILCLQ